MIDVKEDAVSGVWRMEGGALISPLERSARIQLPYLPPEEYDLLLNVEYLKGERSLLIGLTWGGSQCNIISDGWAGDITGLELLDGKSANMNETTFKGQLFPASKVCEVVCSIRKDHMTYTVDGTKVIEWKGNPKRLTVWAGFQVNRKDVLFLGANPGSYRFRKITLVEVSGKGRTIR
jgi:hypothetical protein